jgi:hypothetical protein
MKMQKLIIGIFSLITLSSCTYLGIHIENPAKIESASEFKSNKLCAAIVVTEYQACKVYQIDSFNVHIYPGLANNLKSHFSRFFSVIDIINESETNNQSYDYLIYPDWEIERRNLIIKLKVEDNVTGNVKNIISSAWIEERGDGRAALYLLSSLTIIGFPIAAKIDNNDMSNKIETAMNKAVIILRDALPVEFKKKRVLRIPEYENGFHRKA